MISSHLLAIIKSFAAVALLNLVEFKIQPCDLFET